MTTSPTTAFTGFPAAGLEFLAGIARDNTKAYFDANRTAYETGLLEPAKAFVVALGDELHARVSPGIRAEPRVNGSILRINRDTRFSTDKSPYKVHIDLWFWEGAGPSRERPGYFVRLRPSTVTIGAGMHRFDRPLLEAYRAAVARSAQAASSRLRSHRRPRSRASSSAARRTSASRAVSRPTIRAPTCSAMAPCTCPGTGLSRARCRAPRSRAGQQSASIAWRRSSAG